MAPGTNFAPKDSYEYLEGLGNYHQSEAIPGANPRVNNSPQKPPFGLKTERISGTSFIAPRHQNLQTWMYRSVPSLFHDEYTPYNDSLTPTPATYLSPNSYLWPTFPPSSGDWITSQKLLARNGDPTTKTGLAIWLFHVTASMAPNTAFSSMDGEALIIPQSSALDIQTELGKLLVRQHEICVIPRGIRYRVTLPPDIDDNTSCHGYICELFQGHFQLPNLGIVGSTGLANVRDFQIPVACFDGVLPSQTSTSPSSVPPSPDWTLITRLSTRLFATTQPTTPFCVAAWHGTLYPYKYALANFCVLGNLLFDEHDPCLYTVLTAPNYGSEPGTAVVDFAIIPERWMASEGTLWLPYYHRNTMGEFFMPIVTEKGRRLGMGRGPGKGWAPFGAGYNGGGVVHGASEEELGAAENADTKTPKKVMTDGFIVALLETEKPLFVSDWAVEVAVKNVKGKRAKKGGSRL